MVNQEIEVEGVNIEEALKKGLEKLSLEDKNQIEWEVLSSEEGLVRLRVKRKKTSDISNKEELVRREINAILEKLGTTGKIRIEKENDRLYVDIRTKDMDGILIGKSGKTLESFQHLLSRIIHSKDDSIELYIDVAGYRRKRERSLSSRAKAFAEEVKRSGREYIFQPLPPSLRRVIHLAVSEIEGVRTYTIGDSELKKVVIAPARGK
ncbi:MAG: R3H domain-containing nucleic acid-binding protein [candidate division WOR-3 bacterium]